MKCYLCNNKAIGKYTPDLDIKGIGFCKKHQERVKLGYIALMTGNKDVSDMIFNNK